MSAVATTDTSSPLSVFIFEALLHLEEGVSQMLVFLWKSRSIDRAIAAGDHATIDRILNAAVLNSTCAAKYATMVSLRSEALTSAAAVGNLQLVHHLVTMHHASLSDTSVPFVTRILRKAQSLETTIDRTSLNLPTACCASLAYLMTAFPQLHGRLDQTEAMSWYRLPALAVAAKAGFYDVTRLLVQDGASAELAIRCLKHDRLSANNSAFDALPEKMREFLQFAEAFSRQGLNRELLSSAFVDCRLRDAILAGVQLDTTTIRTLVSQTSERSAGHRHLGHSTGGASR